MVSHACKARPCFCNGACEALCSCCNGAHNIILLAGQAKMCVFTKHERT